MKKIVYNILIKILLIIELFKYILPKSILIAYGIYGYKSISEEKKCIFNIKASLTGILSKNMLDNITVTINNNDALKAFCIFPEEKRYVYNKTILINCSINNIIYNENISFSLSFKGENKYIYLINFNEKILYSKKTFNKSKIDIVLILGEIIEQNCKQSNELYYYNYKIKIENKTIPKIMEIYNNDYDLIPNGLLDNNYNITCKIENTDFDKYINCSFAYYKKVNNALFYNQKYVYKKEISNYNIYIINSKENLYIGKNINCKYVKENIINIIDKKNLRSMADDAEYNDTNSKDIYDSDDQDTEIWENKNNMCMSTCKKCSSLNICTECIKGYYLQNNLCLLCPNACIECSKNECTKCLVNTYIQYKLNNGNCNYVENQENITENNINKQIKLKYDRIDSYKKTDNKVFFNAHFWILNYYIYGSKLAIKAKIKATNVNTNILRHLDSTESIEQDITCTQYNDDNSQEYLANFQCSFDIDKAQKLASIEPISFSITNNNKDSDINIQNIQTKEITVDELNKPSLESDFDNYSFNKMLITSINGIKLDKNLTFNIKGTFDNDIQNDNAQYEIIIKKNNSQQIEGDCIIKASSQILSCSFSKDNLKEKETLEIEEGVYKSINNDALIISNLNENKIKVPKKKNFCRSYSRNYHCWNCYSDAFYIFYG